MSQHEPAASEMDAIVTGATTSSHPSATDEVEINRSGSGGTGGPSIDDSQIDEDRGLDPAGATDPVERSLREGS
jgi:hypothetical protein